MTTTSITNSKTARRHRHTKTIKAPTKKDTSARSAHGNRKAAPAGAAQLRGGGKGKRTKQQICLDLLNRPDGATPEQLQRATSWQPHSVRGFLAGTVKKKLGLTLVSEKLEGKPRRYRVVSAVA